MKSQSTTTTLPAITDREYSEQVISDVQSLIKHYERRIESNKQRLDEDYSYHFAWVAEDLYKETFTCNYYRQMLSEMTNGECTVREVVDHYKQYFGNYIRKPYNVRENSTGALHREVSTWKYTCIQDILEYIEKAW